MDAHDLEGLVQGFLPARVAMTAVELDVFTVIGEGASAEEAALRLGAPWEGVQLLLDALVSLGLLDRSGGCYVNTPISDRHLRAGSLDDLRPALLYRAYVWDRWSSLTWSVRSGRTGVDDIARRSPEWTRNFIAAMHRDEVPRAERVVAAIDLAGVQRVLDLGGGSGAYAAAFARAGRDIVTTVFDLPAVTPLSRQYLDAGEVGARCRTADGDFRTDPLGHDFDLVFVSFVCHMNSALENDVLLRKVFQALRPGGRVVLQDHVMSDDRTAPQVGTLFALNQFLTTRAGRTWTGADYRTWLASAGFESPATVLLPGEASLLIAVRPAASLEPGGKCR